jgi:hypothetical protein
VETAGFEHSWIPDGGELADELLTREDKNDPNKKRENQEDDKFQNLVGA